MKKNDKNHILAAVLAKSETPLKVLKKWALKGVYRSPLTNSLLINYPPINAAAPVDENAYAAYTDKISSLPPETKIALYIHIPYCSRKCTFCNYYSLTKGEIPDGYIDLLEKEAAILAGLFQKTPIAVRALYLGGGTPSLLKRTQLDRLFNLIHKHFKIEQETEISFETHPEIMNKSYPKSYIEDLSALGVNRVSLGVQSLDDVILDAINRGHTRKQALQLLKLLMNQSFDKVNVDVIYGGLPFQSLHTMYDTLTTLASFQPTSLSKHFCEIKTGSPEHARYKKDPSIYPNWEENIRTHALIEEVLTSQGYNKELLHMYSNIAQPFSHQKLKWGSSETVLIGLGPGTYGWLFHENDRPNQVAFKCFSLSNYSGKVNNGNIPIARSALLSGDESTRRHIQYAFNYGGINKKYFNALLKSASSGAQSEINNITARLIDAGFLSEDSDSYLISETGEYLSDEIKALFASDAVLNPKVNSKSHKRHHWFPDLDLVKKFKSHLLEGSLQE